MQPDLVMYSVTASISSYPAYRYAGGGSPSLHQPSPGRALLLRRPLQKKHGEPRVTYNQTDIYNPYHVVHSRPICTVVWVVHTAAAAVALTCV